VEIEVREKVSIFAERNGSRRCACCRLLAGSNNNGLQRRVVRWKMAMVMMREAAAKRNQGFCGSCEV
jgi:hypothetical protein